MNARFGRWIAIALMTVLAGCWSPQDRRPGLRLRGDVATTVPSDWGFTNEYKEIELEVHTPYLLRHSLTIWCGVVDGKLHIGARAPETKHWPGWVDRDPDVRLRIGEQIYEVRLLPIDDPNQVARVRRAYASKYQLPDRPAEGSPPIRYWRVEARG